MISYSFHFVERIGLEPITSTLPVLIQKRAYLVNN